jgi:hypothetical protein
MSVFTSKNGRTIHLSQDGEQFKEITLDNGSWSQLSANDNGMLGVYCANKHEETALMIGNYIFQAKA